MMTKGMHAREKVLLTALCELKRLEKEINSVDLRKCLSPEYKPQPNDIMLGVASEELRRLWIVNDTTRQEFMHINDLQIKGERTDVFGRSLIRLSAECMEKLTYLYGVLQESINEEFLTKPPREMRPGRFSVEFTQNWEVCLRDRGDIKFVDIASECFAGALGINIQA